MESSENKNTYGSIFKSTALFGFVQVVRLLVGVIKNKIVAVILGPQGLGIISIYNNVINLIKTGAGLGISQSAVKDVSEANALNDRARFSRTISITNKIVLFTSLLGLVLTIIFSPILSKWGFGDYSYIIPIVILSISVAFEIFVENQLAILKGMRQLKALALASIIGSVVALLTGVPCILIWGVKGIVPSIILSSVSAAYVSNFYVKKIEYDKIALTTREVINEGGPMIKMGIALMLSSFLSYFFDIIILGVIQNNGGLAYVGFFNAGTVLIGSYFGTITKAMNTDYYPRISAVNNDNSKLQDEVFKQSKVALVLLIPLAVLFILFSPLLIRILYSTEFSIVTQYTDWAVFGIMLGVVSDCIGFILIAKQESKLYLTISILFKVVLLPIFIVLYHYYGLIGLGIAYTINVALQLLVYGIIAAKRYKIRIEMRLFADLSLSVGLIILMIFIRGSENIVLKYSMGSIIVALSLVYSFFQIKRTMDLDVISFIKMRYGKK